MTAVVPRTGGQLSTDVHLLGLLPAPSLGVLGAYRRMGELLAEVHRITMPAFGYLTTEILDPLPDDASYMRRQFTKKLAEFAELGGPAEVHDAVRKRVDARAELFTSCTSAVL